MKWLADVAALLAGESAAGIQQLVQTAESMGLASPILQALDLCSLLFGIPSCRSARGPSWRRRWLVQVALQAMTNGDSATELQKLAFGGTRVSLSHYLLRSGWRYWFDEFCIGLTCDDDRRMVPLPPAFEPLYPILRLPLWMLRNLRKRGLGARP
jgi:hypothetical protein